MIPDEGELRGRVARLSLEQKVRLLTGADFWSLYAEPDIGLGSIVLSDGPAGVRGRTWDERDASANVPSPTALAATWDTGRVAAIGGLLAHEARRKGVHVLLAPTVNLHRTPYAGRTFECFSEDPLLSARIGVAYVRGLQRNGVGATVKHFVCNDSETERMTVDVRVDDRTLREMYLAPFEAIVREAGAWAVMASYNGVNGSTMTESPLLRGILHEEWGFDGLVMSDWTAAKSTVPAARAALDLAMPGPADRFGPWGDALVEAVRDGQVDEALVDDKVLRILRLAARVGTLDTVSSAPATTSATPATPIPATPATPATPIPATPATPATPTPATPATPATPDFPFSEYSVSDYPWSLISRVLRETAAAAFVLARNDGVLPLARRGLGRVAVIGPNAEAARTLGGGSATVHPPYTITPLDGLRAAGLDVAFAPGALGHLRTPAARAPWLLRPDLSAPGSEVRFFAASGELIGTEQRGAAVFRWMNGFEAVQVAEPIARLEIRCVIRATRGGRYRLGISGLGRFRLLIDGTEAFDTRLSMPDGADPGEVLMTPPQRLVPVELAPGQQVAVLIEHKVRSSPLAGFGTFLQLDLETPHGTDDELIAEAVSLAASSDVAVVVVGTTAEVESEGFDRTSLALPGRQDELVRRVAAANPRTVAVVNSGAPVLLPWVQDVDAVLLTWFGGQEFGHALADVLLGDAEPGGRLPATWPAGEQGLLSPQPADGVLRYSEGLFLGYRAYDRDGTTPLFPFGHGTGYTTWSYEEITVDCAPPRGEGGSGVAGGGGGTVVAGGGGAAVVGGGTVADGGGVAVCVTVRNTGERRGREVVQVYASRPDSAVERPVRWLAGFAPVDADPGETVTVAVLIPGRAFEHWSGTGWAVEPGTFLLAAGPSSASLPLSAGIDIQERVL